MNLALYLVVVLKICLHHARALRIGRVLEPRQGAFSELTLTSRGPPAPSCGRRHVPHAPPAGAPNEEPSPKVVGGAAAPSGAYPWTVHIESRGFAEFEHACGGTILSEFFVLTAAHCLHGLAYREVRVKVGDHDSAERELFEDTFDVHSWRVHPDFQKGGVYTNDIAILKLQPKANGRGIQYNEFVSPACLPTDLTHYAAGTWCYITGWGLTNSEGFLPSRTLQAASVPLLPQSVCQNKEVMGSYNYKPGMLCAGYLRGQIDACNGDSGGPLVCEVEGKFTVLGVVSWGIDCATENKPGVYADVKYYLDFIMAALHEM